MYTDPIADFLTRIRNASRAGNAAVSMPYSRIKESIGKVLEDRGMVSKCRVDRSGQFPSLEITLVEGAGPLNLRRVSKPGQRVYRQADAIKPVKNGFGISVYSTSTGIMTGDEAKAKGIGGEYLCDVS